jgi:membrane protease YdiL (CAAX protease family)
LDTTLLLTHLAEWLGVVAVAWILSLAPRMRTAPIAFKFPRREGMVALSLGGAAVLFAFVFATQGVGSFVDGLIKINGAAKDLLRPLVLAVVALLPFIAALLTRGQPPLSAGWSGKRMRAGLQTGLAVALLTIFLRNRVMDVLGGLKSDEVTYLLFALGIAAAEETIFRGYLQLRLNAWLGDERGWIAAALFFAVFRFPVYLVLGDLNKALLGLVLAFGEGLAAGWLMRKTNHVLAPIFYRAASIWMNVFL